MIALIVASARPALALAMLASAVWSGPASADGQRGGELFQANCTKCHAPTNAAGTGPGLAGVFGRNAGEAPDFAYSRAMRRAGLVWDEANLAAYLADPATKVPGNKMPYSGLATQQDRADVIDYLKTLK